MRQRSSTPRSLVSLEEAISPTDLNVVFQPIVDLESRATFALEALVRCKAPGLESPPVLFEHAVQHQYTGRLGRLIREQAIQRASGHALFLNVHPMELTERWIVRPDDPVFLHDDYVYLEITESVAFSHYDTCVTVLNEIRSRGDVDLVVDDLGAGFSNLKRIVDLNPSVVKLDRALVSGIDANPRQRMLVESMVDLCRCQDAAVVAEGIETQGELEAIIETGCQFGQGYLLARPAFPIPEVRWP